MQDGSVPVWREILERHHMTLVSELTAKLDSEMELTLARERERWDSEATRERERLANEATLERERFIEEANRKSLEERARSAEESRLRLSESLNQTLRRIRRTSAEHETLQLLLEESPAERSVVLLIENHQARLASWRGISLPEEDRDTPIELDDAAALSSCVETRDPLVAMIAPGEISPVLATALSRASDVPASGNPSLGAKVYLFPVTVRQNTVALLLACGDVSPAPIELLCEAAGMKLESLEIPEAPDVREKPAPVPQLVQIAASGPTWSNLTSSEQALHLRAQRFARVRVAQIRINEPDGIRKGTQTADIYGLLRAPIDAARQEYQRSFMSESPTMVDYLHLELVRGLAREDAGLMGVDYPGPLK